MLNIKVENGQFRFSLGMPGYGDPETWGAPCDPRDPRVDLPEEEDESVDDCWEYEEQLRRTPDYNIDY